MQVEGIWRLVPPEQRAFGRAVRELRARQWMSQEGLGFRAGLHRNYVGALERGETNPTFRTILRVVRGLDMPLGELVAVYERQVADAER